MDVQILPVVAHYPSAFAQCMAQWQTAPNFQRLLRIFCEGSQRIEEAAISVLNNDNLYNAQGEQLDLFGDLLDQPRAGLDDPTYRALLWIRVAANSCRGTAEELIQLFSSLMGGARIFYHEAYPGVVLMQSINGTPIFDLTFVRQVLEAAKPAGVRLDLSNAPEVPFGFDGDTGAEGFGDLDDPSAGGEFASSF